LWITVALLYPDPDSESGSTDLIDSVSETLPGGRNFLYIFTIWVRILPLLGLLSPDPNPEQLLKASWHQKEHTLYDISGNKNLRALKIRIDSSDVHRLRKDLMVYLTLA
jgi:hypothetical protein